MIYTSSFFAQKLEAGVRVSARSRLININKEYFHETFNDTTNTIIYDNTTKESGTPPGVYLKLYPKSNNLFIYQDLYLVNQVYNFTHVFETGSYTRDEYKTKIRLRKATGNLMVGYEFPKTKLYKLFFAGGIKFAASSMQTKIDTSGHLYSKYAYDVARIRNEFIALGKREIGFMGTAGVRSRRLCFQFSVYTLPFAKSTASLKSNATAFEYGLTYMLISRNIVRRQYTESKEKTYKQKYESNAKIIFSIISETGLINKFSKVNYSDNPDPYELRYANGLLPIMIRQTPYLIAKDDTSSKSLGMVAKADGSSRSRSWISPGLAMQVKLNSKIYIKSIFSINKIKLLGFHHSYLNGGYSSEWGAWQDAIAEYRIINNRSTIHNINVRQTKLNLMVGYSNFKKFSPFFEAGLVLSKIRITRKSYDLTLEKYMGEKGDSLELQEYYGTYDVRHDIRIRHEKFKMHSIAPGVSVTGGYKLNNFLLYLNITQTLSDVQSSEKELFLGKHTAVKAGIAYQFAKTYKKQKKN
ncbi:MAG TPA: hypothetical protein VGF30_02050, partial [Bacteroidia bacterium]